MTTLRKCVDIVKSGKTKKMRGALQQLDDYLVKFEQLDGKFLQIVGTLFRFLTDVTKVPLIESELALLAKYAYTCS